MHCFSTDYDYGRRYENARIVSKNVGNHLLNQTIDVSVLFFPAIALLTEIQHNRNVKRSLSVAENLQKWS